MTLNRYGYILSNGVTMLAMGLLIVSFLSCKTIKVTAIDPVVKNEINYIPYYLKVYEADSLFLTNNYQRSYEILDSLFQHYEPLNMEGYFEYSAYIATSVLTHHLKDIDKKIRKGYADFGHISISHKNSFDFYDSIMKTSKLTETEIRILKLEHSKKINLDLRQKIVIMSEEDQAPRIDYNTDKIKFYQEKHKIEIEDIISKYGYPNYKVIGDVSYSDGTDKIYKSVSFTTIFLHQDMNVKEKYLPMMLEGVKKGTFLPADYAAIFDKSIWQSTSEKNNPQQLYGTFPKLNLKYPKKINTIRKSIGLPHLGYEVWRYNQIFEEKVNTN
ncbi:hypothetical protein [Flavobacterium humi]|uniref:Lipoprotein n=1 Tax=Flavobacterium humi TaxID=2562683 RepID=A0A4Z0LB58_9FLAO|nr:hypothetical protein [Flavobacterium humi]TGD58957.1 hypothetical protein E4635_03655 [Flavobacterium humi]